MKRIVFASVVAFAAFSLSGCSFPGSSQTGSGPAILKSVDGGKSYSPKVSIDAKTSISSAEILSFVFEIGNPKRITIGTKSDGVFVSENGAETWRKLNFPPTKTYGIVSDWSRPERLYATGEWQGQGKLYRSDDRGGKWTEIYTEPNGGTVLTALAQSPKNPSMLFVGTSTGALLRTDDAGLTWENLPKAEAPILSFSFDSAGETLYALVSGKGIARLRDNGKKLDMLPGQSRETVTLSLPAVTSIATDPERSGTVYAGTAKGLFKSLDFGDAWTELPILESSKKFPIRAIAINPKNSNEIVYSAALAIYKSVDGGQSWSVYQSKGNRAAGVLRYDPSDPNGVYAGYRSF